MGPIPFLQMSLLFILNQIHFFIFLAPEISLDLAYFHILVTFIFLIKIKIYFITRWQIPLLHFLQFIKNHSLS